MDMVLRRKRTVSKREAKKLLKSFIKKKNAKLEVSKNATDRLARTASFIAEHLAYLAVRHAKARKGRKVTEKDIMAAEQVLLRTRKV